jgi:hypothetical protein
VGPAASEKAELVDAVWESLEADALSLTDDSAQSWITASSGMSKTPPMSSPGSKAGRACSRNCDTAAGIERIKAELFPFVFFLFASASSDRFTRFEERLSIFIKAVEMSSKRPAKL